MTRQLKHPALATSLRLLCAAWYPGRNVWQKLKPPAPAVFHEAQRILAEIGGLRFGDDNDWTRLDPSLCDVASGEIDRYESLLGVRLFPIGANEHQDRACILVDENGIVYIEELTLRPIASGFHIAIERIVKNRPWPQSNDDLRAAGIWGREWKLIPDKRCD